jgi:hypothetical protein
MHFLSKRLERRNLALEESAIDLNQDGVTLEKQVDGDFEKQEIVNGQ